jgi:hypothetical protein
MATTPNFDLELNSLKETLWSYIKAPLVEITAQGLGLKILQLLSSCHTDIVSELLNDTIIMDELLNDTFHPKHCYRSHLLYCIKVKQKYIIIDAPFVVDVAARFSGVFIHPSFFEALVNAGKYALIPPNATPQEIYDLVIIETQFGATMPSYNGVLILLWDKFKHLLHPRFHLNTKETKSQRLYKMIVADYLDKSMKLVHQYINKDLLSIITGYLDYYENC